MATIRQNGSKWEVVSDCGHVKHSAKNRRDAQEYLDWSRAVYAHSDGRATENQMELIRKHGMGRYGKR